jgi:hypothetical protein
VYADVAYEPEWRDEPDGSLATAPTGRWVGELVSPFAVSSPAPEPAEAEADLPVEAGADLPGESGPFSVDGELLAWAAELVQVPRQVRGALGRQEEGEAVGLLVGGGVQDEEWLTNLVFHARHRELAGRPLDGDLALVDEWQAIRDGEVRPRLAPDAGGVADLEGEGPGSIIGNAVRDSLARNAVRAALAGGEQDENKLTDTGFRAAQFGVGGPIKADDPRFADRRALWLRIRDRIVRPLLREKKAGLDRLVPRTRPFGRPCCVIFGDVLLDLASLGTHGTTPVDNLGEVYTRKLGFVDMGHARETADVTLWALTQLRQRASAGTEIELFSGKATLSRDIPVERRVALAQQLAYVDSVEHEIVTIGTTQDLSAFSPEDLPSNLFGTVVAVAAFRADGGSDAAITQQFRQKLTAAGAQPVAVARQVQAAARQRGWWSGISLRKRNLTADPWLIDEHGDARIGRGALPKPPPLVSPDFEYTSKHTGIRNTEFAKKISDFKNTLPASAVVP